jgi:hypothetical protein
MASTEEEEAGARCDPSREGTLALLTERTCGAVPWNHDLVKHHTHAALDQYMNYFTSNTHK